MNYDFHLEIYAYKDENSGYSIVQRNALIILLNATIVGSNLAPELGSINEVVPLSIEVVAESSEILRNHLAANFSKQGGEE